MNAVPDSRNARRQNPAASPPSHRVPIRPGWGPMALGRAALGAALLVVAVLAGCMASDADNEPPNARLVPDNKVRWSAQEFEFDGRGSSDTDGAITAWRFEFGDSQSRDVTKQDDARVRHAYSHGGEFTATLAVTDDGGAQEGRLTDTATAKVAVNERVAVSGQVLNATVTTMSFAAPITLYDGIDRYELTLNLTSVLPAGSSELRVRVLAADGSVAGDKTVLLNSGQTVVVDLAGDLSKPGSGKVEVVAKNGGAAIAGQLRTFYDRGFA